MDPNRHLGKKLFNLKFQADCNPKASSWSLERMIYAWTSSTAQQREGLRWLKSEKKPRCGKVHNNFIKTIYLKIFKNFCTAIFQNDRVCILIASLGRNLPTVRPFSIRTLSRKIGNFRAIGNSRHLEWNFNFLRSKIISDTVTLELELKRLNLLRADPFELKAIKYLTLFFRGTTFLTL